VLVGVAAFGAFAAAGAQSDSTARPDSVPAYRPEAVRTYLLNTYGPLPLLRSAALAGFDQWRGYPKEFPRNGRGYLDRVSSRAAQIAIAHTIRFGVARALDERATRFSPCACKGFEPRLAHALILPYRVDSPGGTHLSVLTPLSDLTSGVLVTSVHPGGFSLSDGLRGGLTDLLASSLIAAGREFWPFHWRPPGV
jgi:hypothetical protein